MEGQVMEGREGRTVGRRALLRAGTLLVVGPGIGFVPPGGSARAEPSLEIPNAGFEEVTGTRPAFWTNLDDQAPYVTTTARALGGRRSVTYRLESWTEKGGLRSSPVPITPGVRYSASCAVYNAWGSPTLALEFYDSADRRIAASYADAAPRRLTWQRVSTLGTAPADAAYARVLLYSQSSPTRTYWDDARLEIVPPERVRRFALREKGHPRYHLGRADIARLRALADEIGPNPLNLSGRDLVDSVVSDAERYAAEKSFTVHYYNGHPVTYDAPPAEPEKMDPPPGFEGAYPYWTALGGAIAERLDTLGVAYLLTGREEFARKVVAYVDALVQWEHWHDPRLGAVADQFTGRITQTVLVAYDQLYDYFDRADRERIRRAAKEKGLDLVYDETIPTGGQIGGTAPVLALGGLVLLGEDDDAEKYLTRACDVFRAYMDARMESGQDEGFSYTSYSTNEMTKALEAL
ncbi:MAG TPA: hypothetical protein VI076_02880, partial [Actinopolymorphaceae bacterium]